MAVKVRPCVVRRRTIRSHCKRPSRRPFLDALDSCQDFVWLTENHGLLSSNDIQEGFAERVAAPGASFSNFYAMADGNAANCPVNNQLCHERSFVFCFCFISNGLTYFVFRRLTWHDQMFHRRHHPPRGNVHTPDLALRARAVARGWRTIFGPTRKKADRDHAPPRSSMNE